MISSGRFTSVLPRSQINLAPGQPTATPTRRSDTAELWRNMTATSEIHGHRRGAFWPPSGCFPWPLTLVLIGVDIPGSCLLREGRHDPRTRQIVFPSTTAAGDDPSTQTERRFDLVHLEAFRYDSAEHIAAWTAHLTGLEQQLRLLHATSGMLTGGTMPEYLFRCTTGVVGLLERLIEDGCPA